MRAVLYLRLSREDGQEGPSQSIENQRMVLRQWAAQRGWTVTEEFVDDGWSGLNFQRPGFQQLLEAVEAGRVKTVLVKDLSRLGRDYIQTGYYLERFFPERGVRLIAVGDGIDTGEGQGLELAPFRSVLNDLYARDISGKVRAVLAAKRQRGEFVGAQPPYGYRRGENGKLVPQPRTAAVVRAIYARWLAGESLSAIAVALGEAGVLSPGEEKGRPGGWSSQMVRRILTHPVYRGDLVQGRSCRVSYKVPKRKKVPPQQWQVVQGTHEPLVTEEQFTRAAQLLAQGSGSGISKKEHALSGLVVCGSCGGRMTFKHSGGHCYLVCSRWNHHPKDCKAHSIREDQLEEAVLRELRELLRAVDVQGLAESLGKTRPRSEKELEQRERYRRLRMQLCRDRAEGLLGEEEYRVLVQRLQRSRQEPAERTETEREWNLWVAEALRLERLERALAVTVVRKIVVGEEVTVEWNFVQPDK
ncbi:MAG: recombinase family protein [Eubacteriales bacterium]|jgi:site-specific DNA recombinase